MRNTTALSRRDFLAGSALVVSFSLLPGKLLAQTGAGQPTGPAFGSLKKYPYLDSWIAIGGDGHVTVFTGKAELGQGIMTALMQCAAEQLAVNPEAITMVTASTARTPNEGYTAGSNSMMESGTAIFHAASQARNILIGWAATDLGVDAAQLKADNGTITAPDGQKRSYGELINGRSLHVAATNQTNLIPPDQYKVMGKSLPRLDIPAKLTGGPIYVQDMRMDNMVHARAVRPPNYDATLRDIDTSAVEKMPGVIKVIREGSYLAVAAEGEYQAILAMRALQQAARWQVSKTLPKQADVYSVLQSLPTDSKVIDNRGNGAIADESAALRAVYRRPYMMHASIGPSCAVALFKDDHLTVWTHSQGVFPLRATVAKMLSMPENQVDCIQVEGSGCYGHNGADDAGADAAIIARALPGRPVRVQWMREDEHGWEPYGSPHVAELRGTVGGDGKISGWDCDLWTMTYSTRPAGDPANLMPAWYLEEHAGPPQGSQIPLPAGGGDRDIVPTYVLPNTHIIYHYITQSLPLRVSALRSLGGYHNVFAVESFMDELAASAKADPVDFRLRHVTDPRARDVIAMAAEKFGWSDTKPLPPYHGRGFGYVRYEMIKAYCAVAVEIEVNPDSGQIRVVRAVAAVDSGNAANPNGIENQIEGCIIQATSWTLYESVNYSESEITSRDWGSYPILRFDAVPDSVKVHVINRPGAPFLGTGEAGMGPTAAAIGNALAHATGVRLRDLPLRADKVRAALLK
ncbi:MAG TPA: molybdopterin cofactor-binding domain-containing protein [Pseudolabrys sp.]|nr:molybdopterin cofactor-binding domain-containing protein [Pseudolabrys sp.]